MRRRRCPYCESLNTAPYFSATKEGDNATFGHVCDDCDTSWTEDEEKELVARMKARRAERATVTARSPQPRLDSGGRG